MRRDLKKEKNKPIKVMLVFYLNVFGYYEETRGCILRPLDSNESREANKKTCDHSDKT